MKPSWGRFVSHTALATLVALAALQLPARAVSPVVNGAPGLCVGDLRGRGTPSGRAPARIDLTWTPQAGAASYTVLRGTVSGGPYVLVGSTTSNAFSDSSGLSNSATYYYVIQPLSGAGAEICQSNQATVAIPAGR